MGVLPLQFKAGENAATLGLTGEEVFDIDGLADVLGDELRRRARGRRCTATERRRHGEDVPRPSSGSTRRRRCCYYQHGGILPYVLRQLLA